MPQFFCTSLNLVTYSVHFCSVSTVLGVCIPQETVKKFAFFVERKSKRIPRLVLDPAVMAAFLWRNLRRDGWTTSAASQRNVTHHHQVQVEEASSFFYGSTGFCGSRNFCTGSEVVPDGLMSTVSVGRYFFRFL